MSRFSIHEIQTPENKFRVYASDGGIEVFIDLSKDGSVIDGTFKPESESGKLFAEKAAKKLRKLKLI